MPLVSMKEILRDARRDGYAIAAFNPVNYVSMKAMVRAAEELDAPVIIQTSVKTVVYWGHQTLANWMQELAGPSPVPVALHLDHCKDLSMIRKCIEYGWTSVMIDASSFRFEENLRLSREVLEMATPVGVGVEAELGEIAGVEEEIKLADKDATLVKPDTAVEFCRQLGNQLAAFAPAIGTAHGVYKGQPEIAFDRLEEMYNRIDIPFALHGGTGLSEEIIQRCIKLGCSKINISTQLKHVFVNGFLNYRTQHPKDYEPLKYIDAQYKALYSVFAEKIQQFGGGGKSRTTAEPGA